MGGGGDSKNESPVEALLREAQAQLRAEDYEGALALYQAAAPLAPERVELEGYIDLLRSRLVKAYRERIGDVHRVPKLLVPPDQITRFNLPADAGFMLSLIDARTSFGELLSLSGMEPFEALRIFAGLLDARIVGFAA